ncbi:MAG TPA: MFS transporter [Actinomycetota bacterium]|nr:MFS transporter [Actinomycetota bacterium]
MDTSRRALRRARTAVAAAFAAHAMLAGLLGPWIPQLKARNGLDAAGLGIALAWLAAGLLIGTRLADPAVRRVGGRALVRTGIPVLGFGYALLPVSTELPALSATFFAIGIASGLVDVAMNIEAVAVERRYRLRVMTAIHGVWSVSLFVGAGLAAIGIALGMPITVHLPLAAALVVGTSSVLLRWLPASGESGETPGAVEPRSASTQRRIALLCLVAGGSFLVEGIAIEWSAVYLRGPAGASPAAAGLAVVAFSGGMATSRFVGDRLVARIGQPTVVRIGAAAAALALGTALVVGTAAPSIVGFAVVGLGLGPVVPLAFRSAGSLVRRGGGSALPIVLTAGYAGSVVGPIAVGLLADRYGLRLAFLVPVLACAAAAFAASAAREGTAQPTVPSTET